MKDIKSEKIVQTAGRDSLGEFAPMFAHLNDDVLFGEVWNEDAISVKMKCIITVVSQRKKLLPSLPMWQCMSAGQRDGRCSVLQRMYGVRKNEAYNEDQSYH